MHLFFNTIWHLLSQISQYQPAGFDQGLSREFKNKLIDSLNEFEKQAEIEGIKASDVQLVKLAFVVLIDALLVSLHLVSAADWMVESLQQQFLGEHRGGDQFFVVLNQLQENTKDNKLVCQCFLVCINFGFVGRYQAIEPSLYQQIRQNLYEKTLMPPMKLWLLINVNDRSSKPSVKVVNRWGLLIKRIGFYRGLLIVVLMMLCVVYSVIRALY